MEKSIDIMFNSEEYSDKDVVTSLRSIGVVISEYMRFCDAETKVCTVKIGFDSIDESFLFLQRFYESFYDSISTSVDFADLYLSSKNRMILAKIAHLHSYALSNLVCCHDNDIADLNHKLTTMQTQIESIINVINKNSLQNVQSIISYVLKEMLDDHRITEDVFKELLPTQH